MKLLLTGATGFIGAEILKQSLAHHYIHHIYVLTRRPLPADLADHKKITQILHDDFETYPPALLEQLRTAGIEACIWALGGKVEQFPSLDEARRVGAAFPIQAAEAFSTHIAATREPWEGFPATKPPIGAVRFPFRFVYISGWGAEYDQFRKLWIFAETRKIKGAAEKGLFEVMDASEETHGVRKFEVVALRPGGVIAGGDGITTLLSEATMPCIAVDRLAKCAIAVALDGSGGKRTMENKECLGEDWAMINNLK